MPPRPTAPETFDPEVVNSHLSEKPRTLSKGTIDITIPDPADRSRLDGLFVWLAGV